MIRLVALALIPILVGAGMGLKWADAEDPFYSSISQVIATLFVAITFDFFATEASRKGGLDGVRLLALIAQSWLGFFACIRALATGGTGVTMALAGAGVTAAAVLVSLALYGHIVTSGEATDASRLIAVAVVLVFLAAAVSLLVF